MEASELTPLMRKRLESAPKFKRWHVAAFFLIGVAATMPPTSFIAPKHYFIYKLRTLNHTIQNETNSTNGTITQEPNFNEMQTQYESFTIVVLSIAIVLFNIVTVTVTSKIRLSIRLVVPLAICVLLLGFSLALTVIDTDDFQLGFFWITMITVFLMTGVSTMAFGSAFGFASVLPPQFLLSVLGGAAFGSVIIALLNIITLLINQDPLTSALYFFASATLIVLLSIFVTIATLRSSVIQFYVNTLRSSAKKQGGAGNPDDAYDFDRTAKRINSIVNVISNGQIIVYVMRKTWLIQLNAFLFHVSYNACFPAIASAIHPMTTVKGDLWSETLFSPVTCFLICYTAQFIGRPMPRLFQFPKFEHWKWMTLVTILRFGFIPLFVFCNVKPRNENFPLIFANDAWPIILNIIFGLTTGYFGALINLYLPNLVTGELKEHASIVAVTFTAIGQTVGGFISVGLIKWIGGAANF